MASEDDLEPADAAGPSSEGSTAEAQEAATPVFVGTFAAARTREGAEHFNTLQVGPRYVFSA